MRTVVGPGVLDAPGGIALDAAGDLFVADTGHCRVVVVPARCGTLDGLHLRPGHAATLAGGSCAGAASIGHPSGVAVDAQGDVFVAEATAQRVQEVRAGSRTAVTVAGTGAAGFNGDGLAATAERARPADRGGGRRGRATSSSPTRPTAGCACCRRPARTLFGQAVTAGHLYTVAGTGVCGSAGQGGPAAGGPAVEPGRRRRRRRRRPAGGRQRRPVRAAGAGAGAGPSTAAPSARATSASSWAGTGSYGPYLADGLPANGPTAELNDPRGLAVGPTGALFVTDGFMHVIRVVPAADRHAARPDHEGG